MSEIFLLGDHHASARLPSLRACEAAVYLRADKPVEAFVQVMDVWQPDGALLRHRGGTPQAFAQQSVRSVFRLGRRGRPRVGYATRGCERSCAFARTLIPTERACSVAETNRNRTHVIVKSATKKGS
jgi:hypothetical protein